MQSARILLAVLLLVLGGTCGLGDHPAAQEAVAEVSVPMLTMQADPVPVETAEIVDEPLDPYEGWESWCEELRPPPCFTDADCAEDRTGQPTRCVLPWWAKKAKREARKRGEHWAEGSVEGECMAKLTYEERDRTVARIDAFVKARCRVKPAKWYAPGRGMALPKGSCDEEALFALLDAMSGRESSKRKSIVHRIDRDVLAAFNTWKRKAKKYENNPHYHPSERWRTYGLYGMISAGFIQEWEPDRAPPELVCRQPEQEEMLLRRYRRVWHKQSGGIDCLDAEGNPYSPKRLRKGEQHRDYTIDTMQEPTWSTLHRGANGRLCPPNDKVALDLDKKFEKRAVLAGLPPYEKVTLEMLGKPIPKKLQNEKAAQIRDKVAMMNAEEAKAVREHRRDRAKRRRMTICRKDPSLRGC